MFFDRFTKEARDVVLQALRDAESLHHNYCGTEHLLLALMKDEKSDTARLLRGSGVVRDLVRGQIEVNHLIGSCRPMPSGEVIFSSQAKQVFRQADNVLAYGFQKITPMHILLSLMTEQDTEARALLAQLDVSVDDICRKVRLILPSW